MNRKFFYSSPNIANKFKSRAQIIHKMLAIITLSYRSFCCFFSFNFFLDISRHAALAQAHAQAAALHTIYTHLILSLTHTRLIDGSRSHTAAAVPMYVCGGSRQCSPYADPSIYLYICEQHTNRAPTHTLTHRLIRRLTVAVAARAHTSSAPDVYCT